MKKKKAVGYGLLLYGALSVALTVAVMFGVAVYWLLLLVFNPVGVLANYILFQTGYGMFSIAYVGYGLFLMVIGFYFAFLIKRRETAK